MWSIAIESWNSSHLDPAAILPMSNTKFLTVCFSFLMIIQKCLAVIDISKFVVLAIMQKKLRSLTGHVNIMLNNTITIISTKNSHLVLYNLKSGRYMYQNIVQFWNVPELLTPYQIFNRNYRLSSGLKFGNHFFHDKHSSLPSRLGKPLWSTTTCMYKLTFCLNTAKC